MNGIPIDRAGLDLKQLIDTTTATHQPVLIVGEQSNAILISEADWNAIQETLYLLSIPGMRESIREGMNTPVEACDQELPW
jgi:antitoxin YefM